MLDLEDTICAPAAAKGSSLRGVIRLSGPRSLEIVALSLANLPAEPRALAPHVVESEIALPDLGEIPVSAFVWPTPRSYTRQKSVELHFPANRVIEEAIVARLIANGARLARPGEFTLRAFLAGRVDLTQAEAILGVIHAESDAELQTGLRQLAGGVFGPLHALREDFLSLLADIEAGLDFVEEDIEFISKEDARSRLQAGLETLEAIRRQIDERAADAARWRIVLAGAPNAGKSSLLNALAGRDAAIVSPQAGTTRDVVEVELEIGGHRALLIDLAGLDALAAAPVDHLAQQKAREAIGAAHLVLHCQPAANETVVFQSPNETAALLRVFTKCDLASGPENGPENVAAKSLQTSAATGEGIEPLRSAIGQRLDELAQSKADLLHNASLQSRASLEAARQSLTLALDRLNATGPDEGFAIDLRAALDHLGEITGAVVTEDVLDRVFSRFCIGK